MTQPEPRERDTPEPTPEVAPAPAPEEDGAGIPGWLIAVIVIAAVGGAAVVASGLFLARSRMKK